MMHSAMKTPAAQDANLNYWVILAERRGRKKKKKEKEKNHLGDSTDSVA